MKPKLADHEWAFHKLPEKDDLDLVLCWECQRSAGAELRPWLDLKQDERQHVFDYKHRHGWPVTDRDWVAYGNQQAFEQFNDLHSGLGLSERRHVLEIDWSADRNQLREAFERLIQAHALKPECAGGRRSGPAKGSLVKLAAFRAEKAGIPRAKIPSELKPLAKWAGLGDGTSGYLSAKHIAATLKQAEALVQEHGGIPYAALFSHLSTPERMAKLKPHDRLPMFSG